MLKVVELKEEWEHSSGLQRSWQPDPGRHGILDRKKIFCPPTDYTPSFVGIGTLVSAKLPERMRASAMHAIGIVTLLVGVSNFLEYGNPLIPLVSVVAGLVLGELSNIDGHLKRFGDRLQKRFARERAR